MTRRLPTLLAVLLLALAARGLAAEGPADDPIGQQLFPPELVMKYSHDIALEDRQRTAIKEAVQKAQAKFLDAQFELQTEVEKLARLLAATPVDEVAALAQLDRVLGLEKEVKHAQIGLLARIKNVLTPAQVAKLRELRQKP